MPKNRFNLIIFLTLVILNIIRFVCTQYCLGMKWYQTILYDNLHHYQLGILLIPLAILLLAKHKLIRDLILAISIGLIIDESMYLFYHLGFPTFSHYHWHGILFEFAVLVLFIFTIKNYSEINRMIKNNLFSK